MKNMFETFKKSIHNPSFYEGLREISMGSAVRYYLKSTLLLSFLMTVFLGVTLVPQGILFVKKYAPEIVTTYFPKELTITLEKGEARVNVPEPYVIASKGVAKDALVEQGFQNMLVIDTTQDFNKKTFEEYKSFALLTKNELVTKSARGEITIQDLKTFPALTIDQGRVLSWVSKIKNSIGYIVFAGLVGTFMVMMLSYALYFIVLLLFACIPLLIAYLKKTPLSYANAYKMSLYAVVPALALKTLLNMAGLFFIPAYFTLLVFMLIISLNMREEKQPELFS